MSDKERTAARDGQFPNPQPASKRSSSRVKRPEWLKIRIGAGPVDQRVREVLRDGSLHTVCESARCPNKGECFGRGTSTFLILGNACTRDCGFCAVPHGPVAPPDPGEPERVAAAAKRLELKYVVVTSVTRDDLPDGGAHHFAATIAALRHELPDSRIEVLIPDFQGKRAALELIAAARPDVLNHNIETVSRLYPTVRPGAVYQRSLAVLTYFRQRGFPTKSGMMLGMGESDEEILSAFSDLLQAGCQILTLGQYLQPSRHHLPVERFVAPDEFDALAGIARGMGFAMVAAGPLVRSSYMAEGCAEILGEKSSTDKLSANAS